MVTAHWTFTHANFISHFYFSLFMSQQQIKLPENISAELAEESGWHLGDGSMNFYKGKGLYQLRGHIKDDREHYEERIKNFYKLLYGVDVHLRDMPKTGVMGFQIWSDEIVKFKHEFLNLPLGRKLNFCMPKILKKFVIDFIRGLFDTDGTLFLEKKREKLYPRVHISTTSQILATEVCEELKNLGLRATVRRLKRKEANWNDLHIISVRGDEMVKKWIRIIKPANPKHIQKFEFYLENS